VTCETDDGSRSEVSGTSRLTLVSRLTSRFSRQSRPSRLSQALAIAAGVFMNNAG
jgi:hypothetical protein